MKVEVQMAVHVVQGEAGLAKFLKLGLDLGKQLRFQPWVGEIAHSNCDWIEAEPALIIDKVRNFFFGKGGMAVQQGEMQADSEGWIFSRELDGVCKARLVHHQACA